MKRTIFLAALAAAALAGCASTSTGKDPVSIGNGAYMLGGLGGMLDHSGTVVKTRYIEQARKFCTDQGKPFTLLRSVGQDATMASYASAEVHFACR